MHLQVVTPLGIVIDRDGVDKLNVKSSTGWLEILPGHEDFCLLYTSPSPRD